MGDLVGAAFGFPAVVFTFALIVIVGYWAVVVAGGTGGAGESGADVDQGDGGGDAHDRGLAGILGGLGLGGVPTMVVLSIVIAVAWFVSFTGSATLHPRHLDGFWVDVALFTASIVLAWAVAWLLVRPLRRLFPDEPSASRSDFLGQVCVIRTGRVDERFGQAEVTARDGSSALVQVRQNGEHLFSAGSTALIYDYDADGEYFFVMPFGVGNLPG